MENYYFPARIIQRAGGELPAGVEEDWFIWSAEISSDRLDAYFTHMSESTLRNFAAEANAGVTFLDSHNARNLGYGQSLNGVFEFNGEVSRVMSDFYTVPGLRFGSALTYQSTDDFIRAIQARLVRDVSVGFYGGDMICDICGKSFYDWRAGCPHWPGEEYAVGEQGDKTTIATFEIRDAHLAEVSAVYDGATPGAMIQRAQQMAEAGALGPEMARRLEVKYRIKLPGEVRAWPGVSVERSKSMAEEKPQEKGEELEQIRTLASEAGAPEGDVIEAVRWLVGENARLAPLADEGRQYRADLVESALAEGVRAMGEAFPAETYRQMFSRAGLEEIKLLRAKWTELAGQRLLAGRQTIDQAAAKIKVSVVPDAAYKS